MLRNHLIQISQQPFYSHHLNPVFDQKIYLVHRLPAGRIETKVGGKSVMAAITFKPTELFGGAMTADIPDGFGDVRYVLGFFAHAGIFFFIDPRDFLYRVEALSLISF